MSSRPSKNIADFIVEIIVSRRGGWSHSKICEQLIRNHRISPGTAINPQLNQLLAEGVIERVSHGVYRLANEQAAERTYDRPVETDDVAATRAWPDDLTDIERDALRLMVSRARDVGGVHRIVRLREQLAGVFGDEDLVDGFVAEAAARQMLACVSTEPHEIHRVDPARIQSML